MTRNSQVEEEEFIFRKFKEISGEPFDLNTLESRPPPEPDLICKNIDSLENVAFEMASLTQGELFQITTVPGFLENKIQEQFLQLPPLLKQEILCKFSDASFIIDFAYGLSTNHKLSLIPEMLRQISLLPRESYGCGSFGTGSLSNKFHWIDIKRNNRDGLKFYVSTVTALSDPTVEILESKLEKEYQVATRAELILYNNGALVTPESVYVPTLEKALSLRNSFGVFKRIWVLDLIVGRVTLQFDASQ